MEQGKTGQKVVDLIKKDPTNISMQNLLAKLKKQYDDAEELDPDREMPINTFKTENTKMKSKLQELINQLVREELSLMEKKKKKEEVDIDLDIEDPEADTETADDAVAADAEEMAAGADVAIDDTSMDLSAGGTGDAKEIGQHLQAALEAAKKLPASETKDKLIRQIGNTALFFLKTQIPASGDQI
jgi:membrane protein involved in colicin uptake